MSEVRQFATAEIPELIRWESLGEDWWMAQVLLPDVNADVGSMDKALKKDKDVRLCYMREVGDDECVAEQVKVVAAQEEFMIADEEYFMFLTLHLSDVQLETLKEVNDLG